MVIWNFEVILDFIRCLLTVIIYVINNLCHTAFLTTIQYSKVENISIKYNSSKEGGVLVSNLDS
jgi:hypothetical protein